MVLLLVRAALPAEKAAELPFPGNGAHGVGGGSRCAAFSRCRASGARCDPQCEAHDACGAPFLCPLRGGMDSSDERAGFDSKRLGMIRKQELKGQKRTRLRGAMMGQKRARPGHELATELALKQQQQAQLALAEREEQLHRRREATRRQLGVRTADQLQAVLYTAAQRGDVFVLDRCIFAGADVGGIFPSAPLDDPLGLFRCACMYYHA